MAAVSANPLLLEWLKEIYDAANERGSKGVTTYKRAYESMKACPLTFNHPSEAQQLNNIGPKLCDRLTKKLQEHCEANGLPMPTKGKRKRPSDIGNIDGTLEDESPEPVKKPRKKKPYVPALRSGPYALVLALSSLPEDSLQSLSKTELQVLAQPYCASSFTVPSEAGKFYTAWSSMKTLVEKDLVQERGRPTRKYNLSDEGWEVARRIKAVEAKNAGASVSNSVLQEKNKNSDERLPASATRPEPSSQDLLNLDGNSDWETMAEKPDRSTRRKLSEVAGASMTKSGLENEHCGSTRSAFQHGPAPERGAQLTSHSHFVDLLSSPGPVTLNLCPRVAQVAQAESQFAINHSTLAPTTKETSTVKSGQIFQDKNAILSPSQAPSLPNFDVIPIEPGKFTVELVLDTREVRAKSDRDYIHDELAKKGIKPILRALELGDFFWVAKLNDTSKFARNGEAVGDNSGELALDWIVERKRLDDLIGSIKDGRLNEQKFRLKKSGLRNVVYLVEEFTIGTEKESFHEAIQSIIASTQVVDGCFVKRSQKLDETIRYIARLTHMLKDSYESKPLHLVPSRVLDGDNHLTLLHHLRTHPAHSHRSYHLTYPTFASLVSKSDNLTLRDVFVRMLMCMRGLSADKALAMQKIWTTPRVLIEAYEACTTDKDRQNLVANRMAGVVGRAQVKRALSEKIAQTWGAAG